MILSMAGGGVPLNFKIVAYKTEEVMKDAKPAENTIGVVTGEISEYIFSATEPLEPVDDMLWIKVGTSSPGAFNALKKNSIQICPLYAKQYISGAWVDVLAMNYLGGAWVGWVMDIILYDSGATDITLEMTNAKDSGTYLSLTLGKSNNAVARALVNLTGQKSLEIVYSNLNGEGTFGGRVYAQVWDKDGNAIKDNSGNTIYKGGPKTSSSGSVTLNISELSGTYMVGVFADNYSASYAGSCRVQSIKVLMEATP